MDDYFKLAVDALATGSISMTLARSRMFREVRWWLARDRPEWVWDFVKCPWCISHWAGGGLTIFLFWHLLTSDIVLWFAVVMAVVALAPLAAFLIFRCYGDLPPVPTEQEWKDGTPQDEED